MHAAPTFRRYLGALLTSTLANLPLMAGELAVRVGGIATATGEIGCALFTPGSSFPLDSSTARQVWLKADPARVTCRFENVSPGLYAVSISHDVNGNRRVDTNFLGLPQEAWGVSNNVCPTLRAPRFDEAQFRMTESPSTRELFVQVAR